jgi:hypothetical protein
VRIRQSSLGWLLALGTPAFLVSAVAHADVYTPPEVPWSNCSGDIGANITVIEARELPEAGASVMAGSQVTFSTPSVAPVTFSVASSPAQLASPNIDQGLAQPLPSDGIHMQGFTSSKAASTPGTVYWQASFSAAEVPGCAGVLSGLITSPVRRLTVSPLPSPPVTPIIPTTATQPPPAATANVSLDGSTITVQGGGEPPVKLTCTGTGTCAGKLTLKGKSTSKKGKKTTTKKIGTTAFSVAAGDTATVELELNPTGRALLNADNGRLNASLTIMKSSPAPMQTHTESVQLTQQKAHGKAKK